MLSFMERSSLIQTGIRMESSLYERLKRNAKREKRSLNNYVVHLLETATAPVIPQLNPDDYPIDEDILRLGDILPEPSAEELERDPKLAYILSK